MEESLERGEAEREISVIIHMNIAPGPLGRVLRHIFTKEFVSLCQSLSEIVLAVFSTLVITLTTSAHSLEFLIERVFS